MTEEKQPILEDLVKFLLRYPHGVSRQKVLSELESERKARGHVIPPKFEEAVQSVYNRNSSDSDDFHRQKKKQPDLTPLFYSPDGKWSGTWAVDREHGELWLEKRTPLQKKAEEIAERILADKLKDKGLTLADYKRDKGKKAYAAKVQEIAEIEQVQHLAKGEIARMSESPEVVL